VVTTPWTFHGGRLAEARARYGDGDQPWLDLSTGINPNPWPGAARMAIDWRHLPDETALRDVEAAAAACFGIDPAHLCALPGTEIGLRLLPDVVEAPAACVTPAYRTHAELVPSRRALDPNALPWSSGSLILANPNNPDGRLLQRDLLDEQLATGEASGKWLAIDEAFADALPGVSLAGRIGDGRRLVIFRSFGKFFGLAGVRLGFVLGPRTVIAGYRAKLGSWPLSSAALAIGAAAYRDRRWIASMRTTLPEQAASLDAVLVRHGFEPVGACPLFRLIGTADATAMFDRLARRAILTRPFDDDPRWLRIGLPGSAEALMRLDRALGDG
jgi:cobalamin biosynthetic protein CobC